MLRPEVRGSLGVFGAVKPVRPGAGIALGARSISFAKKPRPSASHVGVGPPSRRDQPARACGCLFQSPHRYHGAKECAEVRPGPIVLVVALEPYVNTAACGSPSLRPGRSRTQCAGNRDRCDWTPKRRRLLQRRGFGVVAVRTGRLKYLP